MMNGYILATVHGDSLSVLLIRIFDPECVPDPDSKPIDNPYEFPESARAYTEHGIPLERGRYPWGNVGDVFPYSCELLEQFRKFGQNNDVDGYRASLKERVKYMHGINRNEE